MLSWFFFHATIFKSSWWGHQSHGWLAQLAEQRTLNPWVQGSIPWPPIRDLGKTSEVPMSFFVLTEKSRAANENRCKIRANFKKRRFPASVHQMPWFSGKIKMTFRISFVLASKNRALLLSSQQLNLNVIMVAYGLLTIRDGNLSSERLLIGNTEF